MTMTESSAKETISDSTKDSSKSKDRKDKSRPLTKVIIRRLPPTMSEETFVEQISPIPDHDYFYFVDADRTLGIHAFCRAYINFVNTDDIFIFKEKFDNYIFVDNRGNEFTAVVEYAPYQGVPKRKSRKNDPKCGTIESDQQYIDFLESLKIDENDTNKQENKTEFSYQIKDDKKITTTPLLEFLAARKVEKQRAKAERKEERRKRDLERKRMRDEERRKKKLEVNKAKPSAITEENSDEASLLKSCSAPSLEFLAPDPQLELQDKSEIADNKGSETKIETSNTHIKTIDFHKAIFPNKKSGKHNPPCQTKFDKWYNERYLQKKSYKYKRNFKFNNPNKSDTKTLSTDPEPSHSKKKYPSVETEFPALPSVSKPSCSKDENVFKSIYNVWSNNVNFQESFPNFMSNSNTCYNPGEYNNLVFVQSMLESNFYNRAQCNNDSYCKNDVWELDMNTCSEIMQAFQSQYAINNNEGVHINDNPYNWNYLWNFINGNSEVPFCPNQEDDPDKTKSSKFQEGAGARVGLPNEKEETPKFGSNKTSKESMKPKGKSFRERRAEESFKKSDDKKVDTKYKYRDDKRNYDTDSKFKKPDYKTNYVRDKKREDDRKFGFKNESKDSKRYESREFRNDNLKTDKKTEIKKYSEARKEREARRIESKRLATKNTTSTESNVKSALPTDNPNDMSEMNKDSAQVETNVENNIDDVENLAENFEEKANIAEDCSSKVEDRVDEDMCNNTEAIEKQESLDSACENVKDTSNMNNTEMTHNVSGDINENKFETEPKRFNCEKRNYDDRRDPRTERRIRNKDRPSMAIYQPGKARLNQKEKSTINPDEPTTEQKSKSVN